MQVVSFCDIFITDGDHPLVGHVKSELCLFSDFITELGVRKQAFINTTLQSEAFDRSNIEANRSRDLVPMPILHSLLSQRQCQRNDGLEVVHLCLHDLGVGGDLREVFVPKVSCHLVDSLQALLKGRVQLFRI